MKNTSGLKFEEEETHQIDRLSRIFLENEDFIRKVIFAKTSDNQQAEDIFQDFFISFISSPPDNEANLPAYITTRLRHDIIDHARKKQRYKKRIDEYSKRWKSKPISNGAPELPVIIKEEREKMINLLNDNLTSTEAEVIKLRHLDDYDTTETAQILEVNKRSASRYLSIGIKKLREVLKDKSTTTE